MNILLFGEFSGFMNCLKVGLTSLGHNVFLASDGDGYKNFPSDFRWDRYSSHLSRRFLSKPKYKGLVYLTNLWQNRSLLRNYDVVLFISPYIFRNRLKINEAIFDYIINNNKRIYVSGAGMTKITFDYWYNSKTKYHDYCEGSLLDEPQCPFLINGNMKGWEERLLSRIDGYIPILYEYAEPYRNYPCIKKTIRIPINVNQFNYRPNELNNGKILFYHGISRLCKGVRFIKPAFEKMQKYYSDQAEFICAERLPFSKYMEVINKANVIVDDANSYSVAMNALFSMLQGKLVMGGAEPIANKELGLEYNPVYNICPDVDQICDVIKEIIEKKDQLQRLGEENRKFVLKYHDHIKIAQQYLDLWKADLDK